jgi:glucosamine-6-phosphate deaminase
MREITKDKLTAKIYSGRPELGAAAAEILSAKIAELLKDREYVNIIFASAPSQNEFLAELKKKDIEWGKINAFHMDEYVGLDKDSPAGFGNFLKDRLFSDVTCREVNYMNGNAENIQDECKRYADLLTKYPTDIVCLGIGENTHLAFNDPHVADFNDPLIVKVVDLDEDCRTQQVNDGCFAAIGEVPTHALTITMPALFKSTFAYAIVPGKFKASAIEHTINSDISELYPSTILRRHDNAVLFIDEDSASRL